MADLLDFESPALLTTLPERLADRLRAAAVTVEYADGETIHSRGDHKPGLSIVREGAVRFAIPGADGSYLTTTILGSGQTFGEATLFAHLPRAYDAISVGRTKVDQIAKPRFDRIFNEEPDLARLLLANTTQRLYAVLGFLDDTRRLPLPVRTAKLIASMAKTAKHHAEVECSQSDLAFTLGVSRVSVGKTLSGLQHEGLISCGYGKIGIIDLAALDEWIAARSPYQPLERGD